MLLTDDSEQGALKDAKRRSKESGVSPENIIHVARRNKRSKFESDTLPLYKKEVEVHLPTPANTICSDEDAAMFLMRLSDPTLPALHTPTQTPSATSTTPSDEGISRNQARPRCARCKKTKKGCDRKRPCKRCVDAGCEDGCHSADESGKKTRRRTSL